MNTSPDSLSQRHSDPWGPLLIVLVVAGGLAGLAAYFLPQPENTPPDATSAEGSNAVGREVRAFCADCHKYPPPDSFPRSDWKKEVAQGYEFYRASGRTDLAPPPQEVTVAYYEKRAPLELPRLPDEDSPDKPPVSFERSRFPIAHQAGDPAVSNVNLVHLFHPDKLDVLVCDMRDGWVSAFQPYERSDNKGADKKGPVPLKKGDRPLFVQSVVLGRVKHPAHAEVVDFGRGGIKDIVVADLGNFYPTNDKVGKVVLLQGDAKGKYTPITLLDGVGRVADVQAGDFNGDGKIDLIVAVFGWRTTGEILYLENQTTDWAHPKFIKHVLDNRHGTIHVPVVDLNGDGKLDFVALISQEHETIVAFLGDGKGHFRKETIYAGPHPAYGSSGIQLVDLNQDGKIDVLYTNGDVMDSGLLKPYHGIQWLENRGTFPFVHHHITSMYGVHRALAGDFRGRRTRDGKKILDIVAVSCLPEEMYGALPSQLGLDSVIFLEQTSPGKFVRYGLEKKNCNHVTCALGALDGDSWDDLIIGDFFLKQLGRRTTGLTIWKTQRGASNKP